MNKIEGDTLVEGEKIRLCTNEDNTVDMENIPAEECRENKVYRINTIMDGGVGKESRSLDGHFSCRSGDDKKKNLIENPIRVVRVKNANRARNTGSVGAQQCRDKSLG